MTPDQRRRYSRNVMLPGIGAEGQKRLLDARVLIVGCGALGSIVAMYLAGSGVGHITIADFDTIDISNLQRQLSFSSSQFGEKKVLATAKRLREINPEVEVEAIDAFLTAATARTIINNQDLIVEGSDNSATKHFIASLCREMGKPCVIGGVREWEGQVSTLLPGERGYLDLFPEPEEDAMSPCALGGVLGPLPGVIGSLQSCEAIKILTGAGTPLASRMIIFDALRAEFREISLG